MPAALRPASTIRKPPNGKIARLNGSSVCNPTITSLSRSIYPALCASIVDGVFASTASTPLFLSSWKKGWSLAQTALVRFDGPTRNFWSPV
jgi:hypothetical protein